MWQVMLAHSNFDFHAAVGIVAQHFHHAGHGGAVRVGVGIDLSQHHLAGLGLAHRIGFEQDAVGQAAVFGREHGDAALYHEPANNGFLRAFNHIEHLAFAAATPIGAGRAHGYRVAVHQAAHLAGGQHEVALAVGRERHGKAEAVFMRFNAAFYQREFFGSAHHAAPVNQDLPVARHHSQAAFEKGHFVLGDIEQDG